MDLEAKITSGELKSIISCFKINKNPITDGISVEFYIVFFGMLERDLIQDMEESKCSSKVLGALDITFITLTPKNQHATTFDDHRPISLCNLIYKLISKIIVNMLKGLLTSIVLYERFGFLFDCKIHDVVGMAQEGMHIVKT